MNTTCPTFPRNAPRSLTETGPDRGPARTPLVVLAEDDVYALPRRAGRVECVAGVLWVTEAGDDRDRVLRAGGAYVTGGATGVVVQALGGPARLRVG